MISYAFQNGTNDIVANDEQQAIRDAFALWSAQTDLAFVQVCDVANANIVFSWETGVHGDPVPACFGQPGPFDGANGTLAHQMGGPAPNNCGAQAGHVHFDDDEDWTMNMRGDINQPIDLLTVTAHELGHALGLLHTQVNGSLMEPFYNGSHRFLGPDDIAGIQSIYGIRQNGIIRSPNINLNTQPICGSLQLIVDTPLGTTVIWSSSDPNGLAINSSGYAARQNNFNGEVTITATINSGCESVTLTKLVSVGTGQTGGTYSYGWNRFQISGNTGIAVSNSANTIFFDLTNSSRPNTYSWSVTSSGNVSHNLSSSNNGSITLRSGASANAVCTINTLCGQTSISFSCYNYSGFRMMAYPNPVNSDLTIAAVATNDDKSFDEAIGSDSPVDEKELNDVEVNVQLLNQANKVVEEGKLKKGKLKLSVSKLPSGTYYLHMIFGDKILKKQIVVQR